MQVRNYTRWRLTDNGALAADILGAKLPITADPATGMVGVGDLVLSPDEARMYGVRLTEAAALADADRAIRALDATAAVHG